MSKCENCIHYECCCDWVSSEDLKDLGTGENCATYKDKSLLVELPCALYGTIYWVDKRYNRVCKLEVVGIKISADTELMTYSKEDWTPYFVKLSKYKETWFTDKEEAEAKLRNWGCEYGKQMH
jgi:hypothetical protein